VSAAVRRATFPVVLAMVLSVAPRVAAETAAEPAATTTSAAPSFLELAERLRNVGSFEACTVDALRHAYQHPTDRERGFDRAALCLSLAGRFDDARRLLLALPGEGTPLGARARLRLCLTEVFLSELTAPACPTLETPPHADPADQLARATLRMRVIRARRWTEARQLSAAAPAAGLPGVWQEQDRELIRRYETLPRKSAWLAGALSALVPGLGRLYIGRVADGIMSFVLIGVTGGLAAQGFHDEGRSSVRGWILGSVASLLYVGNVYGSAVGALVQRHDAEDALMQEIDRAYERRLDP
jgi:TM2 domain-containing membrane protein YozV